ncbi:MAG: WYL domain-containing protein, partial [Xanthomonadales bacterium]|nr:WYL domain-containing protein [Xanthomonadales bacterium]
MKASRLLSLLMLLQSRQGMSAGALAQALEVSVRTIQRDIDALSAAGVPVFAERGRNGGFRLRPGWSTRLTGLTEAEVDALFLAGLPGPATELGLAAAAASARLKVTAALPAEWRQRAEQVRACLHVDPPDWHRVAEKPALLRDVARAIHSSTAVRIRYESWNATSVREIHPLGLVLKAGVWYLVASSPSRADPATYRLGSVLALEALSRRFRRPRRFDLARHWSESTARFERERQAIAVELRASPRARRWMRNERVGFVDLPSATTADGWTGVRVAYESLDYAVRQLLAFGNEIEVLAPTAVRRRLAEVARDVHARHARAL